MSVGGLEKKMYTSKNASSKEPKDSQKKNMAVYP